MAFTPFSDATNVIQSLPNRPGDAGMTAPQLKGKFDQIGDAIKAYINETLLDELEGDGGAGNIGIAAIAGIAATNIQAALEAIVAALASATTGTLPDASITSAKLSSTADAGGAAVETANIADGAVEEAKLHSNSVTETKIKDGEVKTAKLADKSVTGGVNGKLALATVTNDNMAADAIHSENIKAGEVKTANLDAGAVTYDKTSGMQKQATVIMQGSYDYVTVPASGWPNTAPLRQTVTGLTGVLATSKVLIGPWVDSVNYSDSTTSNWERIRDYGIRCVANGDGSLTFECDSAPANNVWFSGIALD